MNEERKIIINGVCVNFEEFKEKLNAAMKHYEFNEASNSSYGHGYNMGLSTMYYSALTVLLELDNERLRKGGKKVEI